MTEDLRAQITRRMADVGGRLRVKSALNPVLWLCAVVTVPVTGFATFATGPHLADRLLGRARVHPIGFGRHRVRCVAAWRFRQATVRGVSNLQADP